MMRYLEHFQAKITHKWKMLAWSLFLRELGLPLWFKPGPWSMAVADLRIIRMTAAAFECPYILELGAGISTICLGATTGSNGRKSKIVSLEGTEEWAVTVMAMVQESGLGENVIVHHIPYVAVGDRCWYDQRQFAQRVGGMKFNIVVIDAPPDTLCNQSRRDAIPFLIQFMADNCQVFLHDAKRADETMILSVWQQFFRTMRIHDTPCGLAQMSR